MMTDNNAGEDFFSEDYEISDGMNGSISRMDLIREMANYFPDKKVARTAVLKIFELIEKALKENKKVVISNFGTFIPKEKLPHAMKNPKTGVTVITQTRLAVRFKPAKNLTKIR